MYDEGLFSNLPCLIVPPLLISLPEASELVWISAPPSKAVSLIRLYDTTSNWCAEISAMRLRIDKLFMEKKNQTGNAWNVFFSMSTDLP